MAAFSFLWFLPTQLAAALVYENIAGFANSFW